MSSDHCCEDSHTDKSAGFREANCPVLKGEHRQAALRTQRLPMKTVILALMLTVTAASAVIVAPQAAFAGGGGVNPDLKGR